MFWLRQSTASQELPLGYFVDSTDGNTEETGLTIANTDIKIWKTGATTLANKNSGGATHISNGIYYATFDATDTDTLGPMKIFVHVSGALVFELVAMVLPANIYDSLVLGTDYLQTDMYQLAGTTQEGFVLLGAFQLALRTDSAIATDRASTLTIINADEGSGAGAYSNQTDANESIRNALPTVTSNPFVQYSDTVTVNSQTSVTLAASGSTNTNFYAGMTYSIPGKGDGIITAYNEGTKTATITQPRGTITTGDTMSIAVDHGLKPVTLGNRLTVDSSNYAYANIEAIGGDTVPAENLATAFGSGTGQATMYVSITGSIGSLGAQAQLDVNAEVDSALADYDAPTKAEMDSAFATVNSNITTVDTVVDAIKVITDALGASAAALLKTSAETMQTGTVDTVTNGHTPTTTVFQADDITETTADHFNGRVVIFTSGNLAKQAATISDYAAVGGIGQFTVTTLTEAPANNDTFIIV